MSRVLDRLSDNARLVLMRAWEEAGDGYAAEPRHLVLGIVLVGDGLGAKALSNLGVEPSAIRQAMETVIVEREKAPKGTRRLTSKARDVVLVADCESRRLNRDYIGAEHLLTGIMKSVGEGAPREALESIGVTLSGINAEIERLYNAGCSDRR